MKEERKKSVRNALLFLSVSLTVTLLILVFYGLFVQDKKEKQIASEMGHYAKFSLEEKDNSEILEPNLIGYAKNTKKPKIAIFISNLGTNKAITEKAKKLHKNIVLGFLPYGKSSRTQFYDSVSKGYETFIYLPFEPKGYPDNDPGKYPILRKNGSYINIKNIRKITENYNGYVGVYGCFRENLSSDRAVFSPILKYTKDRNKILFLGKTFKGSKPSFMRGYKNILSSNIVIDLIPDAELIKENLDQLILIAKNNDYAIAYVNTYPITLDILADFTKRLDQEGIELVTISNILASNFQ